MNLLQKSAKAWKEIIEYRYLFVYGYKKQLYPINLIFSLNEYPHLAGFQYAKDIALPNYSSAKIADRIIEGKISFDTLKKATQYKDMYRPPKVRPKNLTIGGRYFYGKIQLWIQKAGCWSIS